MIQITPFDVSLNDVHSLLDKGDGWLTRTKMSEIILGAVLKSVPTHILTWLDAMCDEFFLTGKSKGAENSTP